MSSAALTRERLDGLRRPGILVREVGERARRRLVLPGLGETTPMRNATCAHVVALLVALRVLA